MDEKWLINLKDNAPCHPERIEGSPCSGTISNINRPTTQDSLLFMRLMAHLDWVVVVVEVVLGHQFLLLIEPDFLDWLVVT